MADDSARRFIRENPECIVCEPSGLTLLELHDVFRDRMFMIESMVRKEDKK